MTTVLAAFSGRDRADLARNRLAAAGFAKTAIQELEGASALQAVQQCSMRSKVLADSLLAITLSVIIFSIFGALAAVGAVNMGVALGWAIGATIVFALLGALFGIFVGGTLSVADAEHQVQLYREAVEAGAVAIVVDAPHDSAEQAEAALRRERPLTVVVCSPRSRARQLSSQQTAQTSWGSGAESSTQASRPA